MKANLFFMMIYQFLSVVRSFQKKNQQLTMKKILLIITLTFTMSYLSAQVKVGGGFIYGTAADLPGVTAKAVKKLSDKWNISPELNIFISNRNNILNEGERKTTGNVRELYAANLDFHKLFRPGSIKNMDLYWIMGVNFVFPVYYTMTTIQGGRSFARRETDSGVSLNFGFGGQYILQENIRLYLEMKYMTLGNANQVISTFGLLFDL